MIMQNPVLLIAVPLLLAFLIPVFSSFFKGAVRFIPVLAGGFNVIATALLISRASGSVTVTEIGGWASAYGISLLFSSQIGYVILAVNLTALLAIFYYTLNERDLGSPLAYPIAFTLALSGANGMIMTGDLFNLFVFMEMTAIAGYIIAVHKKGYLGTFRFVVLSSVGSALFLMATAALYNATGFLNMALAGESLGGLAAPFISIISVLFIMALSSEAELLPLNGWVAPVYKESSGAGSVFFASVFSGAALFAVIKVM
ncbi:MAG TPA: proton-conducting transporter membrane subunit, partial [Candidatus Mcinerneyibacteriales bacterium]|nr:proton-conducting transporter membrane subunit [Candidatus Mcinerneyibacteriales bacterium]